MAIAPCSSRTSFLNCGLRIIEYYAALKGTMPIDPRPVVERITGLMAPRRLVQGLRSAGYTVTQGHMSYDHESLQLAFLKRCLAAHDTVILLLTYPVVGHWVTVIGYNGQEFTVYDPQQGVITMNQETLIARWRGNWFQEGLFVTWRYYFLRVRSS